MIIRIPAGLAPRHVMQILVLLLVSRFLCGFHVSLPFQRSGYSSLRFPRNKASNGVRIPDRSVLAPTALYLKPARIHNFEERKEWLEQASDRLVSSPEGSLGKGKWHEVVSIFLGWSALSKKDANAPIRMERLLKRLLDERLHHPEIPVTIDLYNRLLDAWACAALFRTIPTNNVMDVPFTAAQRAREILVSLQEKFEETNDAAIQPTRESFKQVLHAVRKTEGPFIARRVLAWMEHLVKTGKNPAAQPTRNDYILILGAYANLNSRRNQKFPDETVLLNSSTNSGALAEGFLRHMKTMDVELDTFCYNIVIKAWTKSARSSSSGNRASRQQSVAGREAAEHADRILETMEAEPDLVTYASIISAWGASGMRTFATTRAEELLEEMKSRGLEPNTICLNALCNAWVKSRNPQAVERTEELLRQMEESNDKIRPDLITYNTHLHAASMHSGKRPEYAQKADRILKRMENQYDHGEIDFCPNLFSYNLVIDAHCRSDNCMAAADVLRKLIKRGQPDNFSFNQVLNAFSRSSVTGASRMAEELLFYMEAAYKSGMHPNARPDAASYASVICAHSRSGEPEAAERAQALLNVMKKRAAAGEHHLKPNRYCYNALIAAWGTGDKGTLGARKAEALLQEMLEGGDSSISPNIVTFNSLLRAWARSGTRCCGIKAETYLDQMWELYEAGDKKVKPNDFSYNTVINAISKSKNEGKAQKALRILRRMDLLYQAGNKEARPNEVTYTAVLNSCAFPAVPDPRTRRKALDTAIFTLEELQSSRYGHPNQVTYGTFILATRNLLGKEDDVLRRQIIERAFGQCCKDGQVGDMVLNHLRKTSPCLYKEISADFVVRSGARLSVADLPLEWRCNVRSKDQWKAKPNSRSKRRRKALRHKNEKRRPRPLHP